ncbi:hypothetical protein ACTA71_003679 [Dictyostelium dimigraforme]
MDVTVDYEVCQSYDHISNTSIGTDGLGTCVGVIARLDNGDTYCGHISCEISGIAANIPTIRQRTQEILTAIINPANVTKLHCATTSNSADTRAIYDALTDSYPNSIQPMMQGSGIYFDGNDVGVVNGLSRRVVGTTVGPNEDNGPLRITN